MSVPPFDEFYLIYAPLVRSILHAIIHELVPEQLEDLVQETFLKAWKAYGRLEDTSNLKAWVSCIAQHVAYDTLRRLRTARRVECRFDLQAVEQLPDGGATASGMYSGEADLVAQTLRSLSQKDQTLLALVAHGYTRQEMAAFLGLSRDSCRMRLMRARIRFRRQYRVLCEAE